MKIFLALSTPEWWHVLFSRAFVKHLRVLKCKTGEKAKEREKRKERLTIEFKSVILKTIWVQGLKFFT